MKPMRCAALLSCFVMVFIVRFPAQAQMKTFSAVIKDSHSEEPVPFASVPVQGTTQGGLTDSSGYVLFHFSQLAIGYAGGHLRRIPGLLPGDGSCPGFGANGNPPGTWNV